AATAAVEPPPAAPAAPAPSDAPDWPEMPRVGRPGTATDEQVEALMQLRILPAPPCRDLHDYSKEEAQLFLDAVAFARAVASQVTGGEDEEAPPEVLTALLNDLMGETLADDELRAFASRWARNGAPRPIRENTTFERVRAVVLRHWQPAEAVTP
ncbi:MAG: hypothetical protein SNJ73_06410, partial [Acetobacteraceae bacterium]